MNHNVTPIGETDHRNSRVRFGIKIDDRRRHVYIVGKTGVGKSTLLENMIIADIKAGHGVGVIDPHGELVETLLDFIPESRLEDVVYLDPSDTEHPIGFNPLERVSEEQRPLVASGMMGVFKKIWPDVWSARMEYILSNTILALLEYPGATLLGILRMFSDKNYRKEIVSNLKDPVVKHFWMDEFASYTQRLQIEAVAAIQNKVGQFVTNPLVRNIVGQHRSSIDMKEIMDNGKILIVNLSKGKIGEENTALLGAMIVTKIQLAAMSRGGGPKSRPRDFFLYVDEFQNFATDSFAGILSEARKYGLSLTLAHQYINQLVTEGNTRVRDAIFGNVGTFLCFRVGAADAEFLEKEFLPEYNENDLVNLSKFHIYIKLMIDGVASKPFSAATLPPQESPLDSPREMIIEFTRKKYATPRARIEKEIEEEWQTPSEIAGERKLSAQVEAPLGKTLRSEGLPAKKTRSPRTRERKEVDIAGLQGLLKDALKKASQNKKEENTE